MRQTTKLNELIIKDIKELSDREKQEVLNFIEFLRIKEDRSFIEYVNWRTQKAIEAKKRGEVFFFFRRITRRIKEVNIL